MVKRRLSPIQRANLARGREILFRKQLRQQGINPNPQPIIREVVTQPIVSHTHTTSRPVNLKVSLFNSLLETKLFTIETKNKKETLNLREMINRINARLSLHWEKISVDQQRIDEIISYLNTKEKENEERFKQLEKKVEQLEKNAKTANKA